MPQPLKVTKIDPWKPVKSVTKTTRALVVTIHTLCGYKPLSLHYWLKDLKYPNPSTPGLLTFLNPRILTKP